MHNISQALGVQLFMPKPQICTGVCRRSYLASLLVAAITLVAADLSVAGDLLPLFRFPAGVIVDPEEAIVPVFLGRALSRSFSFVLVVVFHDRATQAQAREISKHNRRMRGWCSG